MLDYKSASPDKYNVLKEFARINRLNATLAEQVLWEHIRAGQIGYRVWRQYVVGDYIVDFLLPEINLIIEVDGAYHSEREQQEDDAIREKELEKMDYSIIRFSNEEVLYNIEKVIELIYNELAKYE